MSEIFQYGGVSIWFLILLICVIIFAVGKSIYQMYFLKIRDSRLVFTINSIIFWGAIAIGVSIFGFFNGLYVGFQDIARMEDLTPAIISKGALMALYNMFFGLLTLLFSMSVWFFLKWRYNKSSDNAS